MLQDVGECKNAQMVKKCEKITMTFVLQTAVWRKAALVVAAPKKLSHTSILYTDTRPVVS